MDADVESFVESDDSTGGDGELPYFEVLVNHEVPRYVQLDPQWRAAQPRQLDFIAIYGSMTQDGRGNESIELEVLCVEFVKNVAYRVSLAEPWPLGAWLGMGPEEKIIALG